MSSERYPRKAVIAAPDGQVARIRVSIEKFGVCQPILISKDRTIVHGHGVVEAARAAGLTQIPVIFVEHLSPTEQRLLPITLNRLGETGQWDEEALRMEFAELIDLGEDVVVSGFEAAEIDFLLLDDESDDGVGELDPALVAAGRAVSRPGELWVLGRHRLLQADARDPASYEGRAPARGRSLMAKSKPPKPTGQYDVGYGRPPVHSRFSPGQSGNPAGRRKGQPTPNEIFMKEAARLVKIKRGDTVETITKFEAIVRRMLQSAMEGDIAAARLVFIGLAQNAPDPSGGPADDETANVALSATPDDETLRRMVARFAHLQPRQEEVDS